jgi:hypothetical protein
MNELIQQNIESLRTIPLIEHDSYAEFKDGKRSYLSRTWDATKKKCVILMHDPSTADDMTDDTTIKRCISICRNNGYGGIQVYNINHLVDEIQGTEIVIAWGNSISKKESKKIAIKLRNTYHLLCFSTLKNGNPGLPTRLQKHTMLRDF